VRMAADEGRPRVVVEDGTRSPLNHGANSGTSPVASATSCPMASWLGADDPEEPEEPGERTSGGRDLEPQDPRSGSMWAIGRSGQPDPRAARRA
jgi:hypothetical protein